jgi:DNA-directed RNA polymerase subunit N (RpoN/RPB10)
MAGKTHRIGKSVIEVAKVFASEENCHNYLEAARWPRGVRCFQCGSDKISKYTAKGKTRIVTNKQTGEKITKIGPDRYLYQCMEQTCKFQFTTTVGTLFNDTHLPLNKWFMAIAIMCNAKKGASAKQIERDLGVSYKTAWYLCHRIRKGMDEGFEIPFEGKVECDETYVGGRYDRRRNREPWEKQPVFGALQRGTETETSKVRTFPIPTASKSILTEAVKATVSPKADLLITDQNPGYKKVGKLYKHETVNHIELEYVRKGDARSIHTNSIENFWSNFKRGVIGSFHQVSVKHLQRYLNEFSFRFNNRFDQEIFALVVINLVIKSALPYKALTGDPKPVASSDPLPSSDEPF